MVLLAVGSVLISVGDALCFPAANEPARPLGVLVSWGCGYYSDGDSRGTVGRGLLTPGSFGWCLQGRVVGSSVGSVLVSVRGYPLFPCG